ncbi:glycoside hydrolase family 3 protein [Angustibacter speluncae]
MPVPRTARVLAAGAAALLAATLAAPAASAAGGADAYVRSTMRQMTTDQKIGQLFVTYAYGTDARTVTEADAAQNLAAYGVRTPAEVVDKYGLGGVIYFAWSNNVANPQQIAKLSNGLQRAAAGRDTKVDPPLLISTDQEMGVVVRVGPPATQLPGSMALGATRDPRAAQQAAQVTGRELRAIGINQNYAPDADVNVDPQNPVIGVRSFSSDPALVSQLVAAQVTGFEQPGKQGVSSTAKHFPGHGDTSTDSHYGLPVIDHTREEWERLDEPPFRAAVEAGIDSIMTAHIVVPSLDPSEDPATLSQPILTGLLRERLGYDGVVVTDSLQMAGVREKYGDDEVAVRAVLAGADQLLMPMDMDVAYEAVQEAVASGRISQERLDQSVERILRMKYERGVVQQPYVTERRVERVVGTPEHQQVAQSITDRTVTAVANPGGALPTQVDGRSVLVTGAGVAPATALGDRLAAQGAVSQVVETGLAPTATKQAEAVAAASGKDLVVVLTNKAWSNPGQQQLVSQLQATGVPVVVVAVRDPYDASYVSPDLPFLATYSSTAVSMESVVRVLTGQVAPTGKLPVDVPVAGQPDQVLYPFGHGLGW